VSRPLFVPTVIAALYSSNIVVYKDEFGSKNIKSEFLFLVKKIMSNDVPNIGVGKEIKNCINNKNVIYHKRSLTVCD